MILNRKKPALRALNLACTVPWAITPDALQTILEIAARENPDLEAVEARLGRPLDNTHDVTIRDGVATIPVTGPIMRYADIFSAISGATSIDTLATDLRSALDNPAVSAIVLAIDSPGGEVNGTAEFADMVHAARAQKPIVAYISGTGCSAAYWIASACSEVVADSTAVVGSIGVVSTVRDPKATSSKSIEFVSSQSPGKRPDPTTEKGRSQIQGMVDDLASVFVATVARNRGISEETVLAEFGQGGVFIGQKAVDAGLVDRVGSYEGVLSSLAAGSVPSRSPLSAHAADSIGTPIPAAAGSIPTEDSMNPENPTPTAEDEVSAPVAASEDVTTPETEATTPTVDMAALLARIEEQDARIAALAVERDSALQAAAAKDAEAQRLAAEAIDRDLTTLASGWHGETSAHVALLKTLDERQRGFYVQTMNAAAEQLRQSGGLLASAGVSGVESDESPVVQLEGRARALATSEKIDFTQAVARIAAQDPQLYEAYRTAPRG